MDVVQAFQQARNITRICCLGVSVQVRQICLQNVPNIHFYIKNFTADPYLEQASQTFPVYYKFQENRDLNYEKKLQKFNASVILLFTVSIIVK